MIYLVIKTTFGGLGTNTFIRSEINTLRGLPRGLGVGLLSVGLPSLRYRTSYS